MFFKTRKPTEIEKLDAILEYLKDEETRWTLAASPATSESHANKVDARLMYLEEQIALISAKRAIENTRPKK